MAGTRHMAANGKSTLLKVPFGTTNVRRWTRNPDPCTHQIGERYVLAEGGNGGFGNSAHSSPPPTARSGNANPGQEGRRGALDWRRLKLIAEAAGRPAQCRHKYRDIFGGQRRKP